MLKISVTLLTNTKFIKIECGQANTIFKNRIIGGVDTSPHEYPWVAAIFDENNEIYCGGSVISTQHILSAGHCVY